MFGERREIQLGKWTGWWRCREIDTFNQRTNLRVGKWWITVRLDSLSERWISLNYNCIKHAREDSWKLFGTLKLDLKRKTDFVTDSLSLVIFIHRNRWLWSVEGDSAGRNISMGSYDYMDRSLPGWVDKWRQACVGVLGRVTDQTDGCVIFCLVSSPRKWSSIPKLRSPSGVRWEHRCLERS